MKSRRIEAKKKANGKKIKVNLKSAVFVNVNYKYIYKQKRYRLNKITGILFLFCCAFNKADVL